MTGAARCRRPGPAAHSHRHQTNRQRPAAPRAGVRPARARMPQKFEREGSKGDRGLEAWRAARVAAPAPLATAWHAGVRGRSGAVCRIDYPRALAPHRWPTAPSSPPQGPAIAPESPAIVWADPVRRSAFERWLAAIAPRHGLQAESLRAASSDASFRRYLRADAADGRSLIVMDAPPPQEDVRPFVDVARRLENVGLHAPAARGRWSAASCCSPTSAAGFTWRAP